MARRDDQKCLSCNSILYAAAFTVAGMEYFLLDPVGNSYGLGRLNSEFKRERAQVLRDRYDTPSPPQRPTHQSPTKPVSDMTLFVAPHGDGERTPKYQCQQGGGHTLGVSEVGINDFEPEAS